MSDELFPIVTDAAEPIGKAVGGTLADAWQGIVGDRVAAWRIANAVAINDKLRAKLAKSGTTLRQDALPEGIAFRWFEKATQEDEPDIQELFAQLLANAATGNEDALRKRNIDLVSSLSPEDARLLSFIAERFAEFQKSRAATFRAFTMDFDSMFARHYKEAGFENQLPIDNLLSLGILRYDREFRADEEKLGNVIAAATSEHMRGIRMGIPTLIEMEESLALTEVGKSLLLALKLEEPTAHA